MLFALFFTPLGAVSVGEKTESRERFLLSSSLISIASESLNFHHAMGTENANHRPVGGNNSKSREAQGAG